MTGMRASNTSMSRRVRSRARPGIRRANARTPLSCWLFIQTNRERSIRHTGEDVLWLLGRQSHCPEPKVFYALNDACEIIELDGLADIAIGIKAVSLQNIFLRLRGGQHNDGNAPEVLIAFDFEE